MPRPPAFVPLALIALLALAALPTGAQPLLQPGPPPDWTANAYRAAHPVASAQGGDPFTLTGRWAYGPSYAVEVGAEGRGYAGQGGVLRVLDLSAAAPVILGELTLPGVIYDLALAPPYLYVGVYGTGRPEERGVFVVDVADPTTPTLRGAYTTAEGFSAYGLLVDGDRAYVAAFDGTAALYVLDVSQPTAPVRLGRLGLAGFSYGLAVGDGFAYVAGGASGLHVVDVSDPAAPTLATTVPLGGYARRVDLGMHAGVAYAAVAVGSYATGVGYVSLLDLTVPGAPVLASQGPSTQPVEDVAWDGSALYAASSYDGLALYTVDAGGLTLFGSSATSTANLVSGANRVAVGTEAYVADYYNGVHTFDRLVPMGSLVGQSFAFDVLVEAGDPAVGYVADGAYGLVRLDLAAPEGPRETGRVHTTAFNYAYDAAQTPTHLYLADGYSGVWVIQKQGLLVVNNLPGATGFADRVAVSEDGELLLVVDTQVGGVIQAFDLADPDNPAPLWERFDLDPYGVAQRGSVAYVGTQGGAFVHVLDGIDGPTPVLVRSLPVAGNFVGVRRDGERLYAFGGATDVTVFDLADPLDPQVVGVVATDGAFTFEVVDGVLYTAKNVLTAYDVSDPSSAAGLGAYDRFAIGASALAVRGDAVYAAARTAGVYRLASDLVVSTEPAPGPVGLALSASPNPAVDGTTVRYVLREAGPVRLAVYDALGREVAVLVDGGQAAGPHAVRLDADRLPAGRYALRLAVGGATATRLVTLVR